MRYSRRTIVVLVLGVTCAAIGLAMLGLSNAATTSVTSEAEQGTVAGKAVVVPLATASGGKAVRFGGGPGGGPKILWGIGDEIEPALQTPLYRDGAANMLSMWVNNQGDITGWARGIDFTDYWAKGQALEVIPWLADDPAYAVSPEFQTDLVGLVRALATKTKNPGPIYVPLFTEFETYSSDPAYGGQIRQTVLALAPKLQAISPAVKVGFSFGGYDWDDSPTSTNPDVPLYADVIKAVDFVACQQMQDSASLNDAGQNLVVNKTRAAVRQLGGYGKPVMVAHYKNWGEPADQTAAFRKIAGVLFTEPVISELAANRLFAFNFMGDHYINDPGPTYDYVLPLLKNTAANVTSLPPTAGLP